jgi:drug/metabolite transporter (DMT)-like permease
MYRAARGLVLTFVCFAAAFVLHIVAGATDQDWLFAIAVALIFLIATGYSGFALWFAGLAYGGNRAASMTDLLGGVAGSALTIGALWAANDRAFEVWHFAAAPLMEAAVSAVVVFVVVRLGWARVRGDPATS